MFASSPKPLRYEELPYRFRLGRAGESKLDSVTAWDYAMLNLSSSMVGRFVPVGGQASTTLCAMTFNFAVNNVLTYRDMRLRVLACSIGGFASAQMVLRSNPVAPPDEGPAEVPARG